jgi:hypothetical protein
LINSVRRHFWELYQALKNKYPEVELFDFPQKSMFRSSAHKLFRKESFHIFLNLLLTLQPMPMELEHFLEIKKYPNEGFSSASSRASFESTHSIDSISTLASVDYSPSSVPVTDQPLAANNSNLLTKSKQPSSFSSDSPVSVITLTPMALFAYILLFSTWVGSLVWISIKGA